MGTGYDMIRTGRADIVVAGGTEAAIHPLPFAGFAQMQALSTRNDDIAAASRPYDTGRDGFVMGEGAGVMVLEEYEHAVARGARIYAEFAVDRHVGRRPPHHRPRARGRRRVARDARGRRAGRARRQRHRPHQRPRDVDPGRRRRRGQRRSAGPSVRRPTTCAVSATKSMTGHLLGAAGALEGLLSVLSVHHRVAPAAINIDDFDPEIDLDVVRGEHRTLPDGDIAALNNSFGFGGHNVALVVKSV